MKRFVAAAMILLVSAAHAQSEKVFTPDMTWASIQKLPKLWGVPWASTNAYDATQIVLDSLEYPPFKPEFLKQSQERVGRILEGKAEFLQASCKPNGMARAIWYTFAPVFLFQPGDSLILAEAGEFRQVYMDGRPHPTDIDSSDPRIAYAGHSIGWWEGSALVIDTTGIDPGHELFYGVTNGGAMHVVERYELLDAAHLKVTVRVEAPHVLAEPWAFSKTYVDGSKITGNPLARGDGGGAGSNECSPYDARQKVNAKGDVYLDLTPPPPGIH